MKRQIAIIGLGLIGGSMAMALRGFEDYELVGVDQDPDTLAFAAAHGVADRLTDDAPAVLSQADVVYLCLHPRGIVRFLEANRDRFKPGALVTDVCGIKTAIVEGAAVLPEAVDFIGGHPMAGRETSGIFHADGALFRGAHYIITPGPRSCPSHVALLERIARHIGCRDVVNTTTQKHDAIIAYTSQVMHIMAVAVCDDPDLFDCKGFEGGSFRDCTRVAALDVPLWTELFSMNAPALCTVIRTLEDNLRAYREGEGSFDLCACNPPYFTAGFQSSNAARATARHETDCTLEDVCACGFRLLKDGGRLALCHRPERLAEVLAVLRAHRLEPKRLAFVKNRAESAPWLFLVEAQKNRKTGLKIEPDILIAAGAAMYGKH